MSRCLEGRVVLLDMDGPLADFDAQFHDRCVANGWTLDIDHPRDSIRRFMTEHLPDPRERALARRMVDTDRTWFYTLPLTRGAPAGVTALEEAGADLWVVTKPLELNPGCRDGKGAWLRRHFPQLERKLIIAPDKSMVRGDVLVDDAPALKWLPAASWTPVIFPAGFNRDGSDWASLPAWHWDDGPEALAALLG